MVFGKTTHGFWDKPEFQKVMNEDKPRSALAPSTELKDPTGRFWEPKTASKAPPKQVLGAIAGANRENEN